MPIYFKKSCTSTERTTRFFVHLIPADKDDLHRDRRRYGFGGWNFSYHWFDTTSGGRCLVAVPLPDYVITGIRTGQPSRKGRGRQRKLPIK